ncbi:MBL fold metallo-hydrolase [Pontibacter pamirensis]|uniref:MBL fold metallo-hydrolase n=1 Tax=Pontibacter pamirensis TaxID=2562824 RepID=UPI00138A3636|nr:MBL fold metallo-hydrolase [Pontibacter pamirensis]
MKVTAIGHAGLKVQTEYAMLLIDPWLSPEGCFQGSWFQFPDNSHLLSDQGLYKPTAIIISHEHLDHCDPWILSRIDPEVPVIVPKYPSPALKQKILLGGKRRIIEVNEWKTYDITSNTKVFFVSEPPMNHDSAIVIQADGHTLLNMNDARLFPMQLREIKQKVGGDIHMFAFQGAGASWFPMVYDFPEEQKEKLRKQKRAAKLSYCVKSMKIVEPIVGFPFAGPPCFLDPNLFSYNEEMKEGIFPDQEQVASFLAKKKIKNIEVLLPGDTWDSAEEQKTQDSQWENFRFNSRWDYLKEYQERRRDQIQKPYDRYPVPEASLWKAFETYFEELLTLSPYFNEHIDMRVGFEVKGKGGGDWHVDFREGKQGVGKGVEDCGYIYTFESRWLPPVLAKEVPWEDFFLSLRFNASRNPDLYNDHLLGLLKFADKGALEEVAKFETTPVSNKRITIHSDGKTYSVSRYCPHAGNDFLHSGEVLPGGIFRCLAHHYDFDLESGECITSSCENLTVERID